MRAGSSARPVLFISLAFLLLTAIPIQAGQDRGARGVPEIPPEVLESVREAVSGFKPPLIISEDGHFPEVDPLWNDDELTGFINPEAIVFGNPIAQALCPVDCAAASAGYPINTLFWCAGCWGSLYPYTGNTGVTGSPVRVTSLLSAKLLARLLHEQARPLIGRGWGEPENPDCGGFSPGELGQIDFSRVDLREYMQYIQHQTEIPPDKAAEIMERARQGFR